MKHWKMVQRRLKLLIVPEGIEMLLNELFRFRNNPFNRTKKELKLLCFNCSIFANVPFNRTRRN